MGFGLLGSVLPALLLTLPAGALETTRIASGLDRPLFVGAPAGDGRLFIAEQRGVIKLWKTGAILPTPFLDIDDLVIDTGGSDERGLLGLAFHPDFATQGTFFVDYVNNAGNTVIARYHVSADPDLAEPGSAEILLTIGQPYTNHKGGMIAFGADGYLYIGMGDGGSGGDPENRAQNLQELLGKMLRIDVDGAFPYVIPPDNPFANDPEARDEIWAYGLRNPWRWSFDRQTGDLWIADVGQGAWEEIDFQPNGDPGGANYGWRLMEGSHCYNPPSNCDDGTLTHPIYEYAHSNGRCSITGGYVYRGVGIPGLAGTYFFADWCTGEIWSFHYENGSVNDLTDRTAELAPGGGLTISHPSSFGEDGFGELYIVDRAAAPNGEIYRILPDPSTTGEAGPLPTQLRIEPTPNPFGSTVQLRIVLDAPGHLDVRVLDSSGRLVRQIVDADFQAGPRTLTWDGRGSAGEPAGSGAYIVMAQAGGLRATRILSVVR